MNTPLKTVTNTVKVRLARSKDKDRVTSLFRGLLSEHQENQVNSAFRAMRNYGIFTNCSTHILVLENNRKEVVGAVAFDRSPELYALRIDESEQNKQYGKLLVSAVAKFAEKTNRVEILVSSTQNSVPFWKHLEFKLQGGCNPLRCYTQEMCCKNINTLCNFFDNNVDCFDSDYCEILEKVNSENCILSLYKPSLTTEQIYQKFYQIESLEQEIEAHFGKHGNYFDRAFIKRNPQRDGMLYEANTLINSGKSFDEIIDELKKIAAKAQYHHEKTSGSRWFGCGPLANKTCGFKKSVDTIIDKLKAQPDEKKHLL